MRKIFIFFTVIWVVFTSTDFLEVMDAFNKMKQTVLEGSTLPHEPSMIKIEEACVKMMNLSHTQFC